MVEPVHLKTAYTTEQADVLKVLENMLALAREGRVSAVAIAYVRADRNSVSHTWSSASNAPALIGAVTGMQMQLTLESMMLARKNPDLS